MRINRVTILLTFLVVFGGGLGTGRPSGIVHEPAVNAAVQDGMAKATAILLVSDLMQAGHKPTMGILNDGTYAIIVATKLADAPTAAQVNTFATNRGVTGRVLVARFQ